MENNKDYIINIRVSKNTYNKLKNKAKENSESLSSLVRKTLDDSYEIFKDLKKDIFGDSEKRSDGVIYYNKVILAKSVNCDRCKKSIHKGNQVYLGETTSGEKKYICDNCFKKL